MQRILILLMFVLLAAINPLAAQDLPPADPVLDVIAENPDDVSVLCISPDGDFMLNPDEPFALASTYKLVILAEMARQIDEGFIDPDEVVPLEDINAYWLPGTDGSAHMMWLDTLPPDQESVTLAEVARAMILFSSNAAPDYLLGRLGTDGFTELFDLIELENTDSPLGSGYLGLFLALDNHETGVADVNLIDAETLVAEQARLAALYLNDVIWRASQLEYQEDKTDALMADPSGGATEYEVQSDYLEVFDYKGSARDMLRILEAAYGDSVFAEDGQQFMQDTLNWLMDINPANRDVYESLGNKGGSLPSILTNTWYVVPRGSDPISLAVFYRNLPMDLWINWLQTGVYQELELRVISTGQGCSVFDEL